ncbi:hypothetical protein ABID76_002602 [Burkholderia ambifaria]
MPAELRLHRRVGHLAFLQLLRGRREFRHVRLRVGPVEVAAILARTRILRVLLREILELRAALDLRDQVLRLLLVVDEDVMQVVLAVAAGTLHELVIARLHIRFARLVLLQEALDHRAQHDRLLRDGDLRLHVRAVRDAFADRFLHQDFAVHEFLAHGLLQLRAVGLTLLDELRDHRVGA